MNNSLPLISFFKSVVKFIDPNMPDVCLHYLVADLKEVKFKKRELVLEAYSTHSKIGFVAEGIVRGFYIDDKGEEITTRFIDKGGFVTDYSAFLEQTQSEYYFQCIEPTTILFFSFAHIQKGYDEKPGMERFGRLIAESIIKTLENRMRSFHFLDAEKRYLQFIEQKPNIANRVSIKHLSTYLGIKRPSLSRIRKNLKSSSKR